MNEQPYVELLLYFKRKGYYIIVKWLDTSLWQQMNRHEEH